jgi:hypothetical protein
MRFSGLGLSPLAGAALLFAGCAAIEKGGA